jgi:hypothetical protein
MSAKISAKAAKKRDRNQLLDSLDFYAQPIKQF